jgi:hypothetical protein
MTDLTYVVFYDKPWIKFERMLETYLAFAPKGLKSFLSSMPLWLKDKLNLKSLLKRELAAIGGCNQRQTLFLSRPWLIAAILWVPALIAPRALVYLHGGWTWLGKGLGWLNTRVILSLLYFFVVVPIGLIMRLAGRDAMRRRFEPAAGTYRVPSKPRRSNHLEQPY